MIAKAKKSRLLQENQTFRVLADCTDFCGEEDYISNCPLEGEISGADEGLTVIESGESHKDSLKYIPSTGDEVSASPANKKLKEGVIVAEKAGDTIKEKN